MKKYVIIVAGGKGLRMGSDLPKQFLPVGGKPVLMHTLEVFRKYDAAIQLILVLPREQQDFWKQLCREHDFDVEHRVADGGETRFHSVKNGLALVQAPGLVGVHDGVTREAISRAEERKFLRFVKEDPHFCRYYEGIYILFKTGLRISEFCGLTISDIEIKRSENELMYYELYLYFLG